MRRVAVFVIIGMVALSGCGDSSTKGDSASADSNSAADDATNACAAAFNGMSQQQKMEIAFKTSNLANAPGNTSSQYLQAIRVSIGGLADHSSQCLITIMYPPTPAEFQAARSIGQQSDFVADQFSYYSDGSSLERGATGPVRSLPDSVRAQNATLALTGTGNDLDVQISVN